MPRHLVCLSFDFDAISIWIVRDMLTPTAISRGEFGVVAAERILDLCRGAEKLADAGDIARSAAGA